MADLLSVIRDGFPVFAAAEINIIEVQELIDDDLHVREIAQELANEGGLSEQARGAPEGSIRWVLAILRDLATAVGSLPETYAFAERKIVEADRAIPPLCEELQAADRRFSECGEPSSGAISALNRDDLGSVLSAIREILSRAQRLSLSQVPAGTKH